MGCCCTSWGCYCRKSISSGLKSIFTRLSACTLSSLLCVHTCSGSGQGQKEHLPNHLFRGPMVAILKCCLGWQGFWWESGGCDRFFEDLRSKEVTRWPRWGKMPRPKTGVPQDLRQASIETLAVWLQDSCQEGGKGEQLLLFLSAFEALSAAQPLC